MKNPQKKPKLCTCGCGEEIQFLKAGKQFIDRAHYNHWLQTSEAGQKAIVKAARKVIEDKAKAERKKHSELKESILTKSDYEKFLQAKINEIVRLIDFGQPCIATGATKGKRNAGHYFSVGSNKTIRFNLHNIHIQSEHSNSYKGGDTLKYQDGIVNIYGREYLEYMNSLKSTPTLHLTIDELKSALKVSKDIIKELKQSEEVLSVSKRIELRNEFNKRIGIYKKNLPFG